MQLLSRIAFTNVLAVNATHSRHEGATLFISHLALTGAIRRDQTSETRAGTSRERRRRSTRPLHPLHGSSKAQCGPPLGALSKKNPSCRDSYCSSLTVPPTMKDGLWKLCAAIAVAALAPWSTAYELKCHGKHFVPDRILRIDARNVALSCESRYSTVINGSVPGPPLRIPAGKTTWIRVFNDASDQNLTVASVRREL